MIMQWPVHIKVLNSYIKANKQTLNIVSIYCSHLFSFQQGNKINSLPMGDVAVILNEQFSN